MKPLTEAQFRRIVRKLVVEYVSADQDPGEPNFNKRAHADPSDKAWDVGLNEDEEMPVNMSLEEADEDHSETHGGERVGNPRWDAHADPTARNWDTGLD